MFIAVFLSAFLDMPFPGSWRVYGLILSIVLFTFMIFLLIRHIILDEGGRQHAGERIEAADDKYRSLLETSAEGTFMIIGTGITYANFVFLAMCGYTMKELEKMKFEDLFKGKGKLELSLEG